ncbi:MAG: hypothetical protein HN704_08160 [Bacteroidetes bacterium]|nr:hypothetical protein [Bacteroidota bacterium]MBT7142280.1 hypothetical protein [Bacteroidota bacterium]MBT7491565.1 hypothetical protein [Bacteroidota bacterium]
MSIKLDLQYVKQLLEYMKGQEDDELLTKSYWISCIIIYGKCFTDAAKGRGTTLNKEDIFSANSNLGKFHEELMDMRHNYIAHAGDSIFEKMEPRIRLASRGNSSYPHLVYQGYTIKGFSHNVLLEFINIIDYLMEQLSSKIETVGNLVLQEEEKNKTKEEMLEAVMNQRINDL